MTRRWFASGVRVAIALVLAILVPATVAGPATGAAGDEPKADPLVVSAVEFCTLFMDGKDERTREMMDARMQEAVTPALATQIRSDLTGPNGALQRFDEAWREVEKDGYVRYRVPAVFERGTLDLLVVFDGEGKVAGFFKLPHVEPPKLPIGTR
jgi:hypothetical protein